MSIAVFFDLGDTLIIPHFAADGSLQELEVLPFVPAVLNKLKQIKDGGAVLRLGVISNSGSESLANLRAVMTKAELLDIFDQDLLLFSSIEKIDKSQKELFQRAAKRAGLSADRCVYVGENDAERQVAASAGLRTSFHPLHVFHVLDLMMQGK
jgi:FMN phosphatase YigB (HAD superfamily)